MSTPLTASATTEDYSPWPVDLWWNASPGVETVRHHRVVVAEIRYDAFEEVHELWWYGLSSSSLAVCFGKFHFPEVARRRAETLAQSAMVSL